jgi:uncharacterized protein (TIGR03000 family)
LDGGIIIPKACGFVMTDRLCGWYGVAAFITVCVAMPGNGRAQAPGPAEPPAADSTLIRRHDWEAAQIRAPYPEPGCNWEVGLMTAPDGYFHSGWPYGPRVAPPWGYPGLAGGPFVTYPWGWPGFYSGRAGQNWSNGLSLYGPPVPVYGPVPGILGNNDQNHVWREAPRLGIGYGWVGVYAASPRPRPLSVSAWPVIVERMPGEGCPNGPNCAVPGAPGAPAPAAPAEPTPIKPEPGKGGSDAPVAGMGTPIILSVKLPQPAAELFVGGVKTAQTGLDRIYESPPLEAGKQYRYTLTARWIENGAPREMKRAVVGTPGEVVRVDFTLP